MLENDMVDKGPLWIHGKAQGNKKMSLTGEGLPSLNGI